MRPATRPLMHRAGVRRLLEVSLVLVVSAVAAVGFAQAPGAATGQYFFQAFERVTKAAQDNAKIGDYGYNDGICILGAWVKNGDSITFGFPLKKDINYLFIAAGDNDAQDIGVSIEDKNGNVLETEKREAPDAMVPFAPPEDGSYTFRLRLPKSRNNLPCICTVCLLKEKGIDVPLKNLNECSTLIIRWLADTDKKLQRDGQRLELRNAKNQWALYGAVLDKGGESVITNLDLGLGRRALYALGDKNAKDVDLFLMSNGQVVAKDEKTNFDALIDYNANGNQRYSLKMRNYEGQLAIVMSAVFDVKTAK